MAGNLELLRRIDEKDYLTEREHREFLDRLKKDLEELEQYRKVMCKPILDLMKDLEILEILKKYIYFGDDYLMIYNKKQFADLEERKKIKEWLEKNDM